MAATARITTRLPVELIDRLQALADSGDGNLSAELRTVVRHGLERVERERAAAAMTDQEFDTFLLSSTGARKAVAAPAKGGDGDHDPRPPGAVDEAP